MANINMKVNEVSPKTILLREIPAGEPFLGNPWGYGHGLYVVVHRFGGKTKHLIPLSYPQSNRANAIQPFGGSNGSMHTWDLRDNKPNFEDLEMKVTSYQLVDLEIIATPKEGNSK